jgi:hypothetical protein
MPVESTMTLEEYFAQEQFYFSDSKGEAVLLKDMPYPHLVYSMRKLIREWSERFVGTPLFHAMFAIACPNTTKMQSLLANRVSIGYWLEAPGARTRKQVRGSAISVANRLGLVLKFERKDEILYISAEEVPNITLRSK